MMLSMPPFSNTTRAAVHRYAALPLGNFPSTPRTDTSAGFKPVMKQVRSRKWQPT